MEGFLGQQLPDDGEKMGRIGLGFYPATGFEDVSRLRKNVRAGRAHVLQMPDFVLHNCMHTGFDRTFGKQAMVERVKFHGALFNNK